MSKINGHGKRSPYPRIKPATLGLQILCSPCKADWVDDSQRTSSIQKFKNKGYKLFYYFSLNFLYGLVHLPFLEMSRINFRDIKMRT